MQSVIPGCAGMVPLELATAADAADDGGAGCDGEAADGVRRPPTEAPTAILAAYLDPEPDATLTVPDIVLWKGGEVCDVVTPKSRHSCCFTKAYGHHVEGAGSFLQQAGGAADLVAAGARYRARLAAGGPVGDEQCPLGVLRLRYFSDREVARLLGFPPTFVFPASTTRKQRYRMLGNSLSVTVVTELLFYLYREPETASRKN